MIPIEAGNQISPPEGRPIQDIILNRIKGFLEPTRFSVSLSYRNVLIEILLQDPAENDRKAAWIASICFVDLQKAAVFEFTFQENLPPTCLITERPHSQLLLNGISHPKTIQEGPASTGHLEILNLFLQNALPLNSSPDSFPLL